MKTVADVFALRLDGLEQTANLVDDLRQLGATAPAATTTRTRLGKRAVDTRVRITAGRDWEIVSLDGCILYLSAQFELAARDLAEALIQAIASKHRRYIQLPESIRSHNLRQIGELLRGGDNAITAHIDRVRVVQELAVSLTKGRPVRVHSEGFAFHEHNLTSDQLAALYTRAGVQDLWRKIARNSELADHLGTTTIEQTANSARAKLNNFMETRNQIAHRGPNYETVGATVVLDHVIFFRRLMPALADALQDHLSKF